MGSYCVPGTELRFCKMKTCWRWMVVMAAQQYECTWYHWELYTSKWLEFVKFVLHVFFLFSHTHTKIRAKRNSSFCLSLGSLTLAESSCYVIRTDPHHEELRSPANSQTSCQASDVAAQSDVLIHAGVHQLSRGDIMVIEVLCQSRWTPRLHPVNPVERERCQLGVPVES
mgnify:CR=1 FL=1